MGQGRIINKIEDNYDVERLKMFKLPIIKSVNQLLDILCFTPADEKRFFYSKNRKTFLYHTYKIEKKNSNEKRVIEVPDIRVKEVQQLINKHILSKIKLPPSCHGFRKNCSVLTNALPHVGAKTLMKFDIKDFFPSIKLNMVVKQFRFLGFGENVSRYLGYLCVNDKYSLPQGAPTSPYLSNLICMKIDRRIEAFCSKRKLTYTRYADDITISSKDILSYRAYEHVQEAVMNIIDDSDELYSFSLNKKKSHRIINGQRMIVTGVLVNEKANVQRKIYRELDNAIRFIGKYGVLDHMKKINQENTSVLFYKQHLYGLACYINMFDKEKGAKYIERLNGLNLDKEEVFNNDRN